MLREWHWLDGKFVKSDELFVSARLLGFLRGWAIFDYFLSGEEGLSPLTELYLERFYYSASVLKLEVPVDKESLKDILGELVKRNGGRQAFRLVLSAGHSLDGWNPDAKSVLIVFSEIINEIPVEWLDRGISLETYEFLRPIPEVKTTFYAVGKIAQMQTSSNDVLFTWQDKVLETPRSNIFFIKDGAIVTPIGNILRGITRKVVIDIAHNKGITVYERDVPVSLIREMDGAFITGTTKPIVPVARINDVVFDVNKIKDLLESLREELLSVTGINLEEIITAS